jgi:hypothetical protein
MARLSEDGWNNSWWRTVAGKSTYITDRNGRSTENGKESSHSAHANGMNECVMKIKGV